MAQIHFEADVESILVALDLLGERRTPQHGDSVNLPDGGILRFGNIKEYRDLGALTNIEFWIELTTKAAIAGAVAYLINKLRGKTRSLRIERTEVQLDEGEITRIINEKIEIEE